MKKRLANSSTYSSKEYISSEAFRLAEKHELIKGDLIHVKQLNKNGATYRNHYFEVLSLPIAGLGIEIKHLRKDQFIMSRRCVTGGILLT